MNTPALVVLITGTRHPLSEQHKEIIHMELEYIDKNKYGFNRVFLIHGSCSGVDLYAEEVGKSMGWISIPFKPLWKQHGKGAAVLRNQDMIDQSHPHIALAFPAPDSRGTIDCIERIEKYRSSSLSRLKVFKEILLQ